MTQGAGGTSTTNGGLRDLLSSVAHQVESHLQPYYSQAHALAHSTSLSSSGRGVGRRRSRIRSWIAGEHGGEHSSPSTNASTEPGHQAHDRHRRYSDQHLRPDTLPSQSQLQRPRPDSPPAQHQQQSLHPHRNNNDTGTAMDIAEEESVDMLTSLMGDSVDRDVARRILRKYDGNVEKAAAALLEGERGDEMSLTMAMALGMGSESAQQSQHSTPLGTGSHQIQIQSQGWPAVRSSGSSGSGWSTGAGAGTALGATQSSGGLAPQTRLGAPDVPPAMGGRPNTPVIDLTLDDDPDLQRAMQESMNMGSQAYAPSYSMQHQQLPVFGPSERPSDQSWAMVPSHDNQNENNDANYLQNLHRAIEASLETTGDSDALESFPVEQQLRRDGCPVILRPSMHTMVYAASILQGLFYVPQVRMRMASWRPPIPANLGVVVVPTNGPDFTLWALSEIFTHMDLARLCDLNVDKRINAFIAEPWDRLAQPPGELSGSFFLRLAATLESAFTDQLVRDGRLSKSRLLHFQYGSSISEPGELLQETSIVQVDVNGDGSNDLIGRLSARLSKPHTEPGKQSVIFEPSEVVAFELVRSSSAPSTTTSGVGSDRKAFTYPKSIYLDQFLKENVELAQAKRKQKLDMLEEVQRLVLHKKTLSNFDGKDTLKDLRSAIFYFENVADAKDDQERNTSIQATTRKLKGILTAIEESVKAADVRIDVLRTRAETLLDCEELQRFKYDLRVVFVHDGLYGRKHLYSYVHDKSHWWKIADSLIEKVPEEVVLNDQTGLHLGAGPYLLFYSRAMENDVSASPLPWIDDIKDEVRESNREFLSQLPPELVGDIVIDEDAPSVAKNGGTGAGERMDVSS